VHGRTRVGAFEAWSPPRNQKIEIFWSYYTMGRGANAIFASFRFNTQIFPESGERFSFRKCQIRISRKNLFIGKNSYWFFPLYRFIRIVSNLSFHSTMPAKVGYFPNDPIQHIVRDFNY
jgi:hypothetical protein